MGKHKIKLVGPLPFRFRAWARISPRANFAPGRCSLKTQLPGFDPERLYISAWIFWSKGSSGSPSCIS